MRPLLLPILVSTALVGCNGGSSADSAPELGGQLRTLTAIDGYLTNAQVMTGPNCTIELGVTNQQGQYSITEQQLNDGICIQAVAGETVDLSRGVVTSDFSLKAADGFVVSPYSHMVAEYQAQGQSLTQAKQKVVDLVSALGADSDLVFSDYLQTAQQGSDSAQAVAMIGETLVDHQSNSIEQQAAVVEAIVADVAPAVVDPNTDFSDDYVPTVTVNQDGSVQVDANHKPSLIEAMQPDDQIAWMGLPYPVVDVSEWFEDKDADSLSYELDIANEDTTLGLSIDPTNLLQGTPDKLGTFEVFVVAVDEHGTRSHASSFTLNIRDQNNAPQLDSQVNSQLQTLLNQQNIVQDSAYSQSFPLTGLFTDADGDAVTYSLVSSTAPNGLNWAVQGEQLVASGTPTQVGAYQLELRSSDGYELSASTQFNYQVVAPAADMPPVVNPTKATEMQAWLTSLAWQEGVYIKSSFDTSGLFSDEGHVSIKTSGFGVDGMMSWIDANEHVHFEGTPTREATFSFDVLGIDEQGQTSDFTLYGKVNVAGNGKPVLDWVEYSKVEAEISAWDLTQGVPFTTSIDVSGLYSDPEGDALTLKPSGSDVGLVYTIDQQGVLHVTGTPNRVYDSNPIYISANDSAGGTDNSRWTDARFVFQIH
ncbi:putative Ig domain-containing protein [Vibrio sp. LaRot3]|uniref:putative Ig domain-containing protein n=1 Tax=Vibrio sp. LaRot3 TaxID=2998829 RepID=UPI0022CDD6ED|nr:putative Ig domain-containing protein [Vibrio sp. LaRot3]MDA0147080.1 putative Ig domain-containing protein [Vibrio sp. LaRot3]